jgi:hypothetical protein
MGKYDYFVKLMNDYNKAEKDVAESSTQTEDQKEVAN